MRRQLWPAVKMMVVMTVLTGVIYPLAMTGISQGVFPGQSNGSPVEHQGEVVGSRLVGQTFSGDEFFHPRPSAVDYDPTASSGSNLGPTNPELVSAIEARAVQYRLDNGLPPAASIPIDAVTASASGLDPHISLANATLQAPRVAAARGMDLESVLQLVEIATMDPAVGVFETASVNVLELNIALEEASS
ncbi:MAG TPA: potassium-transporting ATPase subunit KdpC [Acidimicrobiia bacterium]|jgi:K+-transporting ATPase ATPase C chain